MAQSGIASIRPNPNRAGVARIPTLTSAKPGIEGRSGPVVCCRNTGPPAASSSSQVGCSPAAACRSVSTSSSPNAPAPPTTGCSWHFAQETLLKNGPRPVSGVNPRLNTTFPCVNRSSSLGVKSGRGSPNCGEGVMVGIAAPAMIRENPATTSIIRPVIQIMIVPPVSSKGSVRPSCGDGGRLGPSETYDGASRAVLYGPGQQRCIRLPLVDPDLREPVRSGEFLTPVPGRCE